MYLALVILLIFKLCWNAQNSSPIEELWLFEACSWFIVCFFNLCFQTEECSPWEEVTYARLGKGQCLELCKWPGCRRISEFPFSAITIRPHCHLIKPTPCLGFEHLKMERNVTGQNLRFPWLSDHLQIHIRLTYHSLLILSASEFVWLSCEWWNLKSYVDVCSMWKTTPRFSLHWKGQRYMDTFLYTQTDQSIHLCTHSTSLDTHLNNTVYCVLTWWEATG